MLFSNIALPALPQAVFDLPRAVFDLPRAVFDLPRAVFDLPRAVFEIKVPLRGIGGTAPNLNFDIFNLDFVGVKRYAFGTPPRGYQGSAAFS